MPVEMCRLCGDFPAYDEGVCRWESCETEARRELCDHCECWNDHRATCCDCGKEE